MTFITPKTWEVGEVLSAVDMNVYVRDNSNALNDAINDVAASGFRYIGQRRYSPAGSYTFEKADPFGNGSFSGVTVRAIRVRCVGGGGAGGGGATTTAGQASLAAGGSSGSYAESLFTSLAALPASVNVVVGAGGTAATGATGGDGGNSTFASGSFGVTGRGGRGGTRSSATTGLIMISGTFRSLSDSTGQIRVEGGAGEGSMFDTTVLSSDSQMVGGGGGSNPLGSGALGLVSTQGRTFGEPSGFGGGGSGVSITSTSTAVAGIDGGGGVVIVDVFI